MSKPKKKKYGEAAFGKSKSAPEKETRSHRPMSKRTRLVFIIVAAAVLLAVIAAVVISCVLDVIRNERADYEAGDLGKYLYISPEDYNGMVIDAVIDPVDDLAINSRILKDLFKTRTIELKYNGHYYTTMPSVDGVPRVLRAGDTVFINYVGYELGEDGTKHYFVGGNNVGSEPSEVGLGSGNLIDGFEFNLVGKNPDEHGKLTKVEDGVITDGCAISITYTLISSDEVAVESAQAVTSSMILDRAEMDRLYGVGLYDALIGKGTGALKTVDGETERSTIISAKLGDTNLKYTDITINSIWSLGENPITIEARFSVGYNDSYLAGKTVCYDIYVDKTQFYEVSAIDETYINKQLGMTLEALSAFGNPGDSIEACYRAYIGKILKTEAESAALEGLDDEIFNYMMEKAEFKHLPEGDVLDYYRSYLYEMDEYYKERETEFGSYNEFALYYLGATDYDIWWEDYLRDLCERTVKRKLVFYYIIDVANLRPTEEELALEIVKVKEEVLKYILGNVGLSPDQFETLEEYNAEVDAYRDLMIENYGEQYFRDNAIYEYSMDRVRGLVTVNYK